MSDENQQLLNNMATLANPHNQYGTETLHSVERHQAVQAPPATTPSHGLRACHGREGGREDIHGIHGSTRISSLTGKRPLTMTTVPAPPVALAVLMVVRDANRKLYKST